ncbi:protein arginine methyltransferase 4A [Actinidia rufa]|uniref:Protein arginine methyltransferase 4A n=1 Tax=Actinidia rufa TaxID=165716 RepID=A0A7J0GDC3_9ERIC|nr:protein arginine methyltransferase 4A [Actinidia rufa]
MMEGLEFSTGNVYNMCFCIGSSLQQYLCIQDNQFLQYPSGKTLILTVKASEAEAKTLDGGTYIDAIGAGGSADKSGMFTVGDKVLATSSGILSLFAALVGLAFKWLCMEYTAKIDVDPETLLGYPPPPPPPPPPLSLSLIRLVINMCMPQNHLKWAGYICKLIAGNPSLDQIVTVIKGKIEEVELPEKADILIYEPHGKSNSDLRIFDGREEAKDAGSPIETLKKMMKGTLGSSSIGMFITCASLLAVLFSNTFAFRITSEAEAKTSKSGKEEEENEEYEVELVQSYRRRRSERRGFADLDVEEDDERNHWIVNWYLILIEFSICAGSWSRLLEEEAEDAVSPIETLKKMMNGTLDRQLKKYAGSSIETLKKMMNPWFLNWYAILIKFSTGKEQYRFAYRDVEQDVPLDLQLLVLVAELKKRKISKDSFKNWGLKKMNLQLVGLGGREKAVKVSGNRIETLKNWGFENVEELRVEEDDGGT